MADEYANSSGNGYGKRTLKRMKLVYKGTEVKFAVNPEDYTQSIPNRVTVTQTKGGAWIDAWGAGIVEFTIKGTTGVRGSTTNIDTGYQRWRKLRSLFSEVLNAVTDGEEVNDLISLYNYTDNEYWYCYPAQSGIELYRSKSRPHMYQYTLHLLGLREIGQPATSSGVIGNPNKALSGGKAATSKTSGTSSTTYGQGDSVTYTIGTKTKSKSISAIQEECRKYVEELEPIIGGKGGKISPVTGFGCTQGLDIQSSGTVSNVTGFTGTDLVSLESQDMLTAEVKFSSRVSLETYSMCTQIKDYSPEVLSTAYSYISQNTRRQRVIQAVSKSTAYDSTLYNLIVLYEPKSIINKSEVLKIKMILLECMNVYREVYKMKDQEDEISTTLTLVSLETLLSNIRALILYFALKDHIYYYDRMDISNELRKLEKIIAQLKMDVIRFL